MRYGSKDEATKTLGYEYIFMLWMLRILGFILMLSGFNMMLSPLQRLLGYIPFVGAISNFMLSLVSFIIVIALYFTTLFVAMIVHSVVALIIASLVVLLGIGLLVRKFAAKKTGSLPPQAA